MSAPSLSNVFSDVYITGNCIIGGTVTSLANPVNSLMTILQDQKAQGTTGGTNGTGWQTRTLNTSVVDQIGVSLGSNQFTLPAGTYYVQISTPACQTNNHRCRLYNVTTSSTILLGTSECAQNSNPSNMSNRSFIDGYFTSAASGTYRVDQYFQTAYTSGGLGMPSLSGGTDVEIYTTVKIIKINSGAALSQWTTGGNNLYYTSGNVGIGLTNPVTILNVNLTSAYSNLYTTTSGGNASIFFVNTADSRRAFVGMDGSGLFAFSTGALALGTDNTPVIFAPNYGSGEKMRILTTGFVGIGTTNPGSLLTVSGGGSFGSGYQTFTAPTGGLIVQGSVGIGTTNPGVNALQVTGNVVTSGFTSNSTNTVFNFDTLAVPFVNSTQVLASTNIGIATASPSSQIVYLSSGPMTDSFGQPIGSYFSNNSTNWISSCHGGNGVSKVVLGYLTGVPTIAGHNSTLTAWAPLCLSGGGANVGVGSTNPQYALDVTNDVNCSGSFRVNTILQPKIYQYNSFSGVTTFDTTSFDLTNFNSVEIRVVFSFNTVSQNVAIQALDAAGTVLSAQESGYQSWRNASTALTSGTTAVVIPATETIANLVGSFLAVIKINTPNSFYSGSSTRVHAEWDSVGCYAGQGATTTLGRCVFYVTTTNFVNRIRFNLSSGTMTGKYSIVHYV